MILRLCTLKITRSGSPFVILIWVKGLKDNKVVEMYHPAGANGGLGRDGETARGWMRKFSPAGYAAGSGQGPAGAPVEENFRPRLLTHSGSGSRNIALCFVILPLQTSKITKNGSPFVIFC